MLIWLQCIIWTFLILCIKFALLTYLPVNPSLDASIFQVSQNLQRKTDGEMSSHCTALCQIPAMSSAPCKLQCMHIASASTNFHSVCACQSCGVAHAIKNHRSVVQSTKKGKKKSIVFCSQANTLKQAGRLLT